MPKIYHISPYATQIDAELPKHWIQTSKKWSEKLRYLGYRSVEFVVDDFGESSYWEFSDEEYVWFLLRFS